MGSESPADQQVEVSAGEAELKALYRDITGTLAQRRAAHRADHEAFQAQVVRCMAQLGEPYFAPGYVDEYAGLTDITGPAPLPEYAPVPSPTDGFGIGSRLERAAQEVDIDSSGPQAFDRLSPEEQASYNKALDECAQAPAPALVWDDPRVDRATEALVATLTEAVPDDVVEARAEYPGCLHAHGLEYETRLDLINAVESGYAPFNAVAAAVGSGSEPQAATGPEWDAATEFERRAAAADAECRHEAHDRLMRLMPGIVSDFRAVYVDELTDLQGFWASYAVR